MTSFDFLSPIYTKLSAAAAVIVQIEGAELEVVVEDFGQYHQRHLFVSV